MSAYVECQLCPHLVNTNDCGSSIYLDDAMAFDLDVCAGYAHRRCYTTAKENDDERRGTRALAQEIQ